MQKELQTPLNMVDKSDTSQVTDLVVNTTIQDATQQALEQYAL